MLIVSQVRYVAEDSISLSLSHSEPAMQADCAFAVTPQSMLWTQDAIHVHQYVAGMVAPTPAFPVTQQQQPWLQHPQQQLLQQQQQPQLHGGFFATAPPRAVAQDAFNKTRTNNSQSCKKGSSQQLAGGLFGIAGVSKLPATASGDRVNKKEQTSVQKKADDKAATTWRSWSASREGQDADAMGRVACPRSEEQPWMHRAKQHDDTESKARCLSAASVEKSPAAAFRSMCNKSRRWADMSDDSDSEDDLGAWAWDAKSGVHSEALSTRYSISSAADTEDTDSCCGGDL